MSVHAVIEIFCKDKEGKTVVAATYEDDDDNCVFNHIIFQEAVLHFATTSGDKIDVFIYTHKELKRTEHFLSKIINPPSKVTSKFYMILKFIENNSNYKGIKVYI